MAPIAQAARIDRVQEFIAGWPQLSSHYEKIAKKAWKICSKQALEESKIGGFSTSRVKGKESLLAKLNARRADGKQYNKPGDILRDIPDLAGVRIVLYFPPQRQMVEKFIQERFIVHHAKRFPAEVDDETVGGEGASKMDDEQKKLDKGKNMNEDIIKKPDAKRVREPSIMSDGYCRQFPGYCADHYWVNLKSEDDMGDEGNTGTIEIQVVSIFRHAWAEVQHDTVYKGMDLTSDKDEQILDGVRGMVSLTETFLSQLYHSRVLNGRFETAFDLGSYLGEYMRVMAGREQKTLPDIELLWQLLNVMDMNGTNTLRDTVKDMDFSLDSGRYPEVARQYKPLKISLTIYIMDHIIQLSESKAKIAKCWDDARSDGSEAEKQYQLQAIVDSFAWFGRVSMTSDWVHQVVNTADPQKARRLVDMIQCLDNQASMEFYSARTRLNGGEPLIDDVIDTLWKHFCGHEKRLVQFVFDLSRLGVRSCAADWDHVVAAIKALCDNTMSAPHI